MSNLLRFLLFILFLASPIIFITYHNADISKDNVPVPVALEMDDPEIFSDFDTTINYQFCYTKNSTTIVFIHLTNTTDEWFPLEACIFERAAILNPESGVCVLTKSNMKSHPKLITLPNLEFAPLDIGFIFNGTPIASWYDDYVLNETLASRYVIAELSDGLRYAYLYKFGGKYLDTDTLVLRNLDQLRNAAGWESTRWIANGELFFDQGHPFLKMVLDRFLKNFRPGYWGSTGPGLVTKVHLSGAVDNATYRILEPRALYPVSYVKVHLLFSKKDKEKVESMSNGSFTLHLYRHYMVTHGLGKYWREYKLPSGCIVEELCR